MNKNSPLYLFTFVIILCIVFGAGINVVHYSTLAMLEKNSTLHQNRIIARAFKLQPTKESAEGYEDIISQNVTVDTISDKSSSFVTFSDTEGHIGFKFEGMGFWDRIAGILVFSNNLSKVYSIEFLDQKETPGLGARIEEPWFKKQFDGITIDWSGPEDERIIISQSSNDKKMNQVDAITWATQTSMALMNFLNSQLNSFKKVYQNSDRSKEGNHG